MQKIKGFQLSVTQIIVLSFVLLIMMGTVLLILPVAQAPGKMLSPLEALFMAASAVCVNGLVVVEPGVQFSLFGQMVLLATGNAAGHYRMDFCTDALVVAVLEK